MILLTKAFELTTVPYFLRKWNYEPLFPYKDVGFCLLGKMRCAGHAILGCIQNM